MTRQEELDLVIVIGLATVYGLALVIAGTWIALWVMR